MGGCRQGYQTKESWTQSSGLHPNSGTGLGKGMYVTDKASDAHTVPLHRRACLGCYLLLALAPHTPWADVFGGDHQGRRNNVTKAALRRPAVAGRWRRPCCAVSSVPLPGRGTPPANTAMHVMCACAPTSLRLASPRFKDRPAICESRGWPVAGWQATRSTGRLLAPQNADRPSGSTSP